MLKQIEGSAAVAQAVALCRPEVICAYPITPQTHIVEGLGEMVKSGELAHCEFINVESEFAALSVAIGASAAGARSYTATASQGILFMAEAVYNAAGPPADLTLTIKAWLTMRSSSHYHYSLRLESGLGPSEKLPTKSYLVKKDAVGSSVRWVTASDQTPIAEVVQAALDDLIAQIEADHLLYRNGPR